MSIMSYNGGTVLAMTGHECVCIATDLRLGEQMTTVATNVKKVGFGVQCQLKYFRSISCPTRFMWVWRDSIRTRKRCLIKLSSVKLCMSFVKIARLSLK